jgi:hypothetical protein
MLCGPTAVGKSTLINTLAGAEISLPGLGATTSAAVIYLHERDDPARLFEYGKDIGELAHRPETIVRHRRPELLHKVLIDTPDIDSVILEHEALTSALVHAADLVLFVTSPGRYKDERAVNWMRKQGAQRAVAFVLNQWDRAGIGVQWGERQLIEPDLREVLRKAGFDDAWVFKVSCADAADAVAENELPALREWLERRLDHSAAAALQERRRLMAWGRLAAALAPVIPAPIAAHPWVLSAAETLDQLRRDARSATPAVIAGVPADIGASSIWPAMPGVFGLYTRFLDWCTRSLARVHALTNPFGAAALEAGEPATPMPTIGWSAGAFGAPVLRMFAEVTRRLHHDLIARPLPVAAVEQQWAELTGRLPAALSALPAACWTDVTTTSRAPTLRRRAGLVVLLGVEMLIFAVLATALWRLASDFASANYASAALVGNTFVLVVLLLLAGHLAANRFFPSLRQELQSELARRMDAAAQETCHAMEEALRQHVETLDRLAREGQETQAAIDRIMQSLKRSSDAVAVDRLFGGGGETPGAPRPITATITELDTRRRAVFE